MSAKREGPADNGDRPPKRQRAEPVAPVVEEIIFARQLQELLVFSQDGTQALRNGIASFKAFLENILYHKDEDNRARQISILREYLEAQKPPDVTSLDRPFLAQLWQAWSFGGQNHEDYLVSAVASVLALLLKTLSTILDLREYGLLLCRTVLQNQHLRLIKRSLDAPKHKEHLISPCLRLLTEVTSFDGGSLAREVYKRREQTFDIATLRRTLAMAKTDVTEEEARRRPSLRTQALRYVLQHLKYLHEGGKVDILKNRGICSSLFQYIGTDPADVVTDLLSTIEQSILKDSELPRSAKAAVLTAQNLERVTEVATRLVGDDDRGISAAAFSWLHTVCTTSSYGVLRQHGWYPPGSNTAEIPSSGDAILTGIEEAFTFDGERSFNVRNTTLLSWILSLRPHANPKERELFIATLNAAPELVAAYTAEKSLQMEPKLSNTWIGLASVMFEIVRLPVPDFLGNEETWARAPPNPAIIIENILPRPLTQKVLTRCLNQSSDLISFFAIRILVLAFQKMRSVVSDLSAHSSNAFQDQWAGCREMLIQVFIERCPKMKDVIASFRQIPDDEIHVLQREAITNLLRLYYEVTPLQALEEQFDISSALTVALLRAESTQNSAQTSETEELRGLELEHLLSIAQDSPGIRWFHKGSLRYCPIVTLLRIHRKDVTNRQIRKLTTKVLVENGILNRYENSDVEPPANALIASVLSTHDEDPSWNLLEDCIARASKKPVKYVDDMEALSPQDFKKGDDDASNALPSILAAVVLEQCPFVAADKSDQAASKASWMRLFLRLLAETGDSGVVLQQLTKQVLKVIPSKTKNKAESIKPLSELLPPLHSEPEPSLQPASSKSEQQLPFRAPAAESDNHPELFRWAQKDIDLAIEDGDLDALILCLCSQHTDIRRQAHGQIIKARLQLLANATLENSAQLALVLGELSETFSAHHLAPDTALPYLTGTFAARAFRIQTQPAADMYPKINKFLIRGPEWRSSRLPGYWFSNTAMSLPEEDDAYWREIRWVLEWLVDGTRTTQDFEILRRGGIFEKVMALAQSPAVATNAFVRELVLQLLFRASGVEGGALSLVTRCGVLSWLDITATVTVGTRDEERAKLLRQRVVESCDEGKLKDWMEGRRRKKIDVMEE